MLNVEAGEVFANLVVARLGANGRVSLSNEFGDAHLIVDVVGWIPTGSRIETVTPARILDTRTGVGAPAGRLDDVARIDLDVLGVGGVPATDVDSVFIELAATNASDPTFVTVWPSGEPEPTASVLNTNTTAPVPNLVVAKVGTSGQISLANGVGSTHLIADVVAYTTSDALLIPLTPDRVLDTRSGVGAATGAVGPGEFIDVAMLGVGGMPGAGVSAAIVNVTAAAPTQRPFITAWPTGEPKPTASSLNMLPGRSVANLVIVPVGDDGSVRLYNDAGSTHLLADVVGYVADGDDFTVQVLRHQYTAKASASTDDDDDQPRQSRSFRVAQSGPDQNSNLVDLNREVINGMITGEAVTSIPYPDQLPPHSGGAFSRSILGDRDASASAVIEASYRSTERSWSWTISASTSAMATNHDSSEESTASAEAFVTMTVMVPQPSTLTASPPCPSFDWGVRGETTLGPDESGCFDPVDLPAGEYRFGIEIDSRADANPVQSRPDRAGSTTMTFTER